VEAKPTRHHFGGESIGSDPIIKKINNNNNNQRKRSEESS
jgi:hypothetical protein